ncbi:MAG: GntR family transcriptional regulator [Erysipelotrichaceae bacterium]
MLMCYNVDMVLKHLSPITLQEQLYSALLQSINNGKYKPGDKLPTEHQLAEMFSVSRVTVRNAIQRLVNEGYIVKKHGKGSFVKEKVYRSKLHFDNSFTANCLKNNAKPSTKIIEATLTAGSDELLNKLKCKSDKLIKLTRIRKVDDIPCIIEIDYLPDRFKFLLSQNLTDTSLTTFIENNTDNIPTKFVDNFSISYSNKVSSEYLKCPLGTPLLKIEQTVLNQDEDIIYLNTQYILTSKYIYTKA